MPTYKKLIVAGIAILAAQAWGATLLLVVSIFSSVLYILFWDGKMTHLDNQGAIGILINLALIVVSRVWL